MTDFDAKHGFSTLVNHVGEGLHPYNSHIMPLVQSSTFSFPDVETGASRFKGEAPGYIYSRLSNPNTDQTARKIAILEGIDLLREQPEQPDHEVVAGMMFASGMAAVTSALQACTKPGDTIIVQEAIYSATHVYLAQIAPRHNIKVVWIKDPIIENWERAFRENPNARLAYVESPSNPTMAITDIQAVASIAHQHGAWLVVDNTFASPWCQRPLILGADVVVHSTTKYLCGHGLVIGGVVVSRHVNWMKTDLAFVMKIQGGNGNPFDAWLTHIGLKTFELRMKAHCDNAMAVARFLETHPKVSKVHYPGLESHADHQLASKQMFAYGGMLSFELTGGLNAGISLMENIRVCTLAVSLGNTDTLVEHPASMSHSNVSAEERAKVGLTDGLVRLSVGIENVEDLIRDLDQALETII